MKYWATTLRHCRISAARKQRRYATLLYNLSRGTASESRVQSLAFGGAHPNALVEQCEQILVLRGLIHRIKAEDRRLLELYYEQALPLEKIATILGIAHAAARKRLSRLRASLRKALLAQE